MGPMWVAQVGPTWPLRPAAGLSPTSGQHVAHMGSMWDPSCKYTSELAHLGPMWVPDGVVDWDIFSKIKHELLSPLPNAQGGSKMV